MTMSTLPSATSRRRRALLWSLTEAARASRRDREVGQALAEGVVVLLRQHGRRHEHGDLLAVHDRLERRADRHLRLAEADVAADQAVHRPRRFHVALDVADRLELVRRLDVGEGRLELLLPRRVGREGVAVAHLARGVELEQLLGERRRRRGARGRVVRGPLAACRGA